MPIREGPACIADPSALPIMRDCWNISLSRPMSASIDARASVRLTRMSFGFGQNTSSISQTTIIVDSIDPVDIEKKYNPTSNAMIVIFVFLSSFTMRSKDSKSVLQPVVTVLELTAASLTWIKKQ